MALRKIHSGCAGMVENLLSVTRLDGDNVKIVKTPTPLDELIDSVLVKFHKHYQDVEVELLIPDELIMVPMDPILMEQVIMQHFRECRYTCGWDDEVPA